MGAAPHGAGMVNTAHPSDVPRLLLRVEEAAEALGVSRTTLYVLLRAGEIPVVRIGRSVRVPLTALERYVEQAADSASLDSYILGTSATVVHDGGSSAEASAERSSRATVAPRGRPPRPEIRPLGLDGERERATPLSRARARAAQQEGRT